ncbi:winged helix-turn-helix domain-containing protein [Geofilum sp. OHC36d9]|uniref:winged helix-turn-helix domain-containing protein n=1 Tax=Geofilum sp. OHC36d9 TaxID=3458413 RepID=UPI00403451A1
MKSLIEGMDKNFDSRIRLGIMSALMVNDTVDFNTLKDLLDLTDGNLASHLKGLEKAGMLLVNKQFIGRKPSTTYQITATGRDKFTTHINALERLIKNT